MVAHASHTLRLNAVLEHTLCLTLYLNTGFARQDVCVRHTAEASRGVPGAALSVLANQPVKRVQDADDASQVLSHDFYIVVI